MMMTNAVKEKLKKGEPAVGALVGMYASDLVEMIGYAGFDFVLIDNEHGAFSQREIEQMIRAAELAAIVPIVRVSYDPSDIQKALDLGAKGIQVPMVNTREEAEQVVKRAKFPPIGQRGAAFITRSARFGKDGGKPYLDAADEQTLIIVHIETPEAVANFTEIVSVPGVDAAFIGPTDLSISLGYKEAGAAHPEFQQVMQRLYDTARELNVPLGNIATSAAGVRDELGRGTSLVAVVTTSVILASLAQVAGAKDTSE
ncbi:HpcH/HpaI aldolase family protein [Brevibacillus fluminis]|uniref:HpcH/HpaI aldolase family protein n=1 Tax=Brevibacillus fluminis TaxID=511487 RepID=UPI003F88869E